jgi:DNA-binding Lrp family transcriptional regulator
VHERQGSVLDAFILVQTEPGKAARIAEQLRSVDGVTEAVLVSGPYDVIARTRVPDRDHLDALVSRHVRMMEGLLRVLPSMVVSTQLSERT